MNQGFSSDPQNQPSKHPASIRPENALPEGLAALKNKNYPAAIALLAPLAHHSTDETVQLKAQVGLVMAYERLGQIKAAIALGRRMQSSSNRQAAHWATQTLEELTRRYPAEAATAMETPAMDDEVTQPFHLPAENNPIGEQGTMITPHNFTGTAAPPTTNAQTKALTWRQAGRSQRWNPLPVVDRSQLWAVSAIAVLLLIWFLRTIGQIAIIIYNSIANRITFPVDLRYTLIYADPLVFIMLLVLVLTIALPWLMPLLLQRCYGAKPFSLRLLEQSSPEAVRLLKRQSNQRRHPVPSLELLPTEAPVLFTYGLLPQKACIVVSQGLLAQLADDEIAALYAAELAHLEHWTVLPLSVVAITALLSYLAYQQLSQIGDSLLSPNSKKQPNLLLQAALGGVTSAFYGLYWVCRLAGLWAARVRTRYGDRTAANLTGNPNGLIRALLKLNLGLAEAIETRKQTAALIESLDLLFPVGPRTALTFGSVYPQFPTPDLLDWDRIRSHRWLSLLDAHPPLGDRLSQICQSAQRWQLEPELDFAALPAAQQASRSVLLLQVVPTLGFLVGLGLALFMWGLGAIAERQLWYEISWMARDQSLLIALPCIGFSLGTFYRINLLFPDIKRLNVQTNPPLGDLLTNATALPVQGQPVRLRGTLLGRPGMGNLLSQDLLLRTESGTIRLHYTTAAGPLGQLVARSQPAQWINTPVTVVGWLRRGNAPWIDVEILQPHKGAALQAGHPIWTTVVGAIAALFGLYVLFTGWL
jgi:Zn-dependent protease with chaperone function